MHVVEALEEGVLGDVADGGEHGEGGEEAEVVVLGLEGADGVAFGELLVDGGGDEGGGEERGVVVVFDEGHGVGGDVEVEGEGEGARTRRLWDAVSTSPRTAVSVLSRQWEYVCVRVRVCMLDPTSSVKTSLHYTTQHQQTGMHAC